MKKLFLVLLFAVSYAAARERVELPGGRIDIKGINLFVEGEFLYWKAYEDGLFYAQSGRGVGSTALPPAGDDFNGKLKKIKPDHKPGYRITLGYGFKHDKEDIRISYLDYRTHGKDVTPGQSVVLWAHSYTSTYSKAKHASGEWYCKLRSLEGDFGKAFFLSKHFILRPAGGIKAFRIDQDLKIDYTYDTSANRLAVWKPKSNVRGIGAKSALETKFFFSKNFSIYAVGAASLLPSKVNATLKQTEDDHMIAHSDDKFNLWASNLQGAVGLEIDLYFASNKCHFGMRIGIEDNLWFGVNQVNHYLARFSEGMLYQENGNLNLSGLTFNARLDF